MKMINVAPILSHPLFHTWKKRDIVKAIEDAPAIDPVHAAGACYCRECDLWNDWDKVSNDKPETYVCSCARWSNEDGYIVYTKPDDFCSYGNRRENN